jgi:hypothetical protein
MPTTPTSTPTSIQNVTGSDPFYSDPTVRLLNFNDPYTAPIMNRTFGQSEPWGTPSYHYVQPVFASTATGSQWYGGGYQSSNPYQSMSTLAVNPANYIAAGFTFGQDSISQASLLTSVRTLCIDSFGRPFRELSAAAEHRKMELMSTFATCGIFWPFIPVDQDMSVLPCIVNNPLVTSQHDKLHHQVARIHQYFRGRAQRRGNALTFDRLGDRAYENGQCDIFSATSSKPAASAKRSRPAQGGMCASCPKLYHPS